MDPIETMTAKEKEELNLLAETALVLMEEARK